jgi:hypothetical protein
MINKLAIKNFYEQHRDYYAAARQSGDKVKWDEQYKWDLLPKLNTELNAIGEVNDTNALEIIEILQKNNPNSGSFCHWIDLDNLHKQLAKKPVTAKALSYLWHTSPETVGQEINSVNNLLHSFFSGEFKLSPSTFGYILSALDCGNFALYREALLDDLIELNSIQKPKNQGEKYQLLNDTARYIGSLMSEDNIFLEGVFYIALNGQDFLYVTIQYPKERDYAEVKKS